MNASTVVVVWERGYTVGEIHGVIETSGTLITVEEAPVTDW